MKVRVHGFRVSAPSAAPFFAWMLARYRPNTKHYFPHPEEATDPRKKNHGRTLWLGWIDQEKSVAAGVLWSPRRDTRYAVAQEVGDSVTFDVQSLAKGAVELTFFVYDVRLDGATLQSHHLSPGASTLVGLFHAEYQAHRDDLVAAAKEEMAKGRYRGPPIQNYQGVMLPSTVMNRVEAPRLLADLEDGRVVLVIDAPKLAAHLDIDDEVVRERHELVLSAPKKEVQWWANLIDRARALGYKNGRVRGNGPDGEPRTVNFDEIRNKMAFAEMEYEEWIDLIVGVNFKIRKFPYGPDGKLLKPIQRLWDILEEHRDDFGPPAR